MTSSDPLIAAYRTMVQARLTEERLIRLYHQGQIFGGVYTGIGHEAIGAATAHAAGPDDLFTPCIRDMTVHLSRGESILGVFRQYLGRATGPTRGRDGNVHYGNLDHGVYTMISHLGAMLAVLVGGVMGRRRKGLNTIGVAYIGDGATSTGDFHEAVNFAAVLDVPVLFVLENNKFAYSTPSSRQFRCRQLADKAAGYGIGGHTVDGNDLAALHLISSDLISEIRTTSKPALLECDTLRVRGHGEHDAAEYIPADLMAHYKARDPLVVAKAYLRNEGVSEETLAAIHAETEAEVSAAYRQALSEPAPDPHTLLDGVYAE